MKEINWIEWNGGDCLVADDVKVIVKWNICMGVYVKKPFQAGLYEWEHIYKNSNIIDYAVIDEQFDEQRADVIAQNGNDGLHYDAIYNPPHYKLLPGIEVIDVREALLKKIGESGHIDAVQTDLWSRAWEYLTRFMDKGGKEDLLKAENYLHRLNTGEWMK